MDGVGEWATATYGAGRGNHIQITHEQKFPHSLGLLLPHAHVLLRVQGQPGEYKHGAGAYGQPRHVDRIVGMMVEVEDDGSIWTCRPTIARGSP